MALPQPPPQQISYEQKMKEFDSVPLFMRSLPDSEALTDDTAISALQSLAHEGTPDEVAQNFKEQGNDYFKGRRYREAQGFYTQGIDAKPTDAALLEALLCNRAACNLELQNYGSVLKDCARALSLNPLSSKAYYRSALATLALDRPEEALDACDRCLSVDPQNMPVKELRSKAAQAKEKKEKLEAEREKKKKEEEERKRTLRIAFQDRNLIPVANPSGSENPYSPHFDPDDATKQTLIIPTFFLYPQYAQSDFVSHLCEDTRFGEQLATMFPPQADAPSWDSNGDYVIGNLVLYAITHKGRLLKVGQKMTLREVCKAAKGKDGERDGLEVKDGCVSVVVLPKGTVEQGWVQEFKAGRAKKQ